MCPVAPHTLLFLFPLVLSREGWRWRGRRKRSSQPWTERDRRRKDGLRMQKEKGAWAQTRLTAPLSSCQPLIDREDWGEDEEEEDGTEEPRKDGDDWREVRIAWDATRVTAPLSLASSKQGSCSGLKEKVTAGRSSPSIIKLLYMRRTWRLQSVPPLPPFLLFVLKSFFERGGRGGWMKDGRAKKVHCWRKSENLPL